jgi:hypothetical protein
VIEFGRGSLNFGKIIFIYSVAITAWMNVAATCGTIAFP